MYQTRLLLAMPSLAFLHTGFSRLEFLDKQQEVQTFQFNILKYKQSESGRPLVICI